MMYLSDLPTGALAHVSSYLAAPSRALFAVALDHRDVDSSSAIAGDDWEALDFGDIEKDLAAKLSDDDIRGVLLSIDAVNNLKRLRLTNCINISGAGLDPLRGSTIIQHIDLSLVGDHESAKLDPEPPISCAEVLPILDSIIERGEDCSLEHLQFPNEWRKERNTESDFHAFLTRYNDYLSRQAVVCLKCRCNLPGDERTGDGHMLRMDENQYGTQNFTCYDCMKHYCYECQEEEKDDAYCMSSMCDNCNKRYCLNCCREGHCTSCDHWYCLDCIDMTRCFQCEDNTCLNCVSEIRCDNNDCVDDNIWCYDCVESGNVTICCDGCDGIYCSDCSDSYVHAAKYCNACDDFRCGECRVTKCMEGSDCTGCYQLAFPSLLEDRERTQNENEDLEKEINDLRRKIKDLSGEIDEV
mmetsp:Transcript_3607/g.7595  ORF Transcript_3607/g.7595 Transcript_3607/m.7595 type:complete len:412 (-) Transcript_3607:80-1315(-)